MSKTTSQTKKPHLKTQEELVGEGMAFSRSCLCPYHYTIPITLSKKNPHCVKPIITCFQHNRGRMIISSSSFKPHPSILYHITTMK